MAAHFDDHHRQREHEADPEPARHVGEFGIGAIVGGNGFRLERHAADRAGARTDLTDLRMHRAGVDRARDDRRGFALAQIFLRIGGEFGLAAGGAEIIRLVEVFGAVFGSVRIDAHATYRIGRAGFRGRAGVMAVLMGGMVGHGTYIVANGRIAKPLQR